MVIYIRDNCGLMYALDRITGPGPSFKCAAHTEAV